jgi:hypothetical protein
MDNLVLICIGLTFTGAVAGGGLAVWSEKRRNKRWAAQSPPEPTTFPASAVIKAWKPEPLQVPAEQKRPYDLSEERRQWLMMHPDYRPPWPYDGGRSYQVAKDSPESHTPDPAA